MEVSTHTTLDDDDSDVECYLFHFIVHRIEQSLKHSWFVAKHNCSKLTPHTAHTAHSRSSKSRDLFREKDSKNFWLEALEAAATTDPSLRVYNSL